MNINTDAFKMFEGLGWKGSYVSGTERYLFYLYEPKDYTENKEEIIFNMDKKTCSMTCDAIDSKLLKAIYQQFEDLGWFKGEEE